MSVPSEARQVRVVLVDDDSGLVTLMVRRFEALRWDHEVLSYAPGPDQLAAMRVNALVLNPALSGIDYIERIGVAMPGLAVLAVSGPTQVADRVRALRSGADDWVTKPCHPEELIARIQAIMRRRRSGEALLDDDPTVAGELTIRPDQFDAYVAGEAAGLSRKEYELLRQLAAAEGRVLERELIYQRVWGYTMVRGDRSVDVFVRKLRNKLERISPQWRYVHTHFGVGYRFAAEQLKPNAAEQLKPTTNSADPAAATATTTAGSRTAAEPAADAAVRLDLTAFR
jgi:DNA-binding response OmpR family regulator